jgi:hypothetical protein
MGKGTRFVANVRYSYQLDNQSYTGTNINFAATNNYPSLLTAQKEVEKYPLNSNITIFYHPIFKEISVLEPGFKKSNLKCLWIGCGIILFPFIYFLFFPYLFKHLYKLIKN